MTRPVASPMRIEISTERRERLAAAVQRLFRDEFDRELSDFQTSRVIDFFVGQVGPLVYNQAIQDARAFVQGKLDDLEGEIYEPDEPR